MSPKLALRDQLGFSREMSLSVQRGHGLSCRWFDPVAHDPYLPSWISLLPAIAADNGEHAIWKDSNVVHPKLFRGFEHAAGRINPSQSPAVASRYTTRYLRERQVKSRPRLYARHFYVGARDHRANRRRSARGRRDRRMVVGTTTILRCSTSNWRSSSL